MPQQFETNTLVLRCRSHLISRLACRVFNDIGRIKHGKFTFNLQNLQLISGLHFAISAVPVWPNTTAWPILAMPLCSIFAAQGGELPANNTCCEKRHANCCRHTTDNGRAVFVKEAVDQAEVDKEPVWSLERF